jgi:hypothetical protein
MAEDREEARGRAAPAIRIAFFVALAATSLLLVLRPLFTAERRVDVLRDGAATMQKGRDTIALFPRLRFHRFPGDGGAMTLLEDGRPLERPAWGHEAIAALGSGRWSVAGGRAVHFSSSDGTDPLANGRRYELVYVPDVIRSWPALGLFALTVALLLAAARAGVLVLRGPSPLRTRAGLATVIALAFAAGLSERWDRVNMVADAPGYLLHLPIRTALYPAFVDAFDREPATPRANLDPLKVYAQGARSEPDGRFTNVVRAQKALTVLALLALFASLASALDAWCVAAIFLVGALLDPLLGTSADAGVWSNVESIASEGLNHPLVFLHLALAFACFARFTWPRGVALALVTSLLLLNRPANLPFVLVLPLVAVAHAGRDGRRRALLRAGALALVFAAPLAGECARNRAMHGHFELHAFGGLATIGIALETATPEDAEAFDDPRVRDLVSACARDPRRCAGHHESPGLAINTNMYEVGDAHYRRIFGAVDDRSWDDAARRDEVLGQVARRLLARHPLAWLDIVLFHLEGAVDGLTVLVVLVLVASVVLHRRARAPALLFLAYATFLPLALLLLSCAVQAPLDRYRSQTWLVEVAALPLLATILAAIPSSESAAATSTNGTTGSR